MLSTIRCDSIALFFTIRYARWINIIYLDNAATTKPKECVVETINKCFTDIWGNPSSLYGFGIKAKSIINDCRKTVAKFIGAKPDEIIFTSGACESNSLAICGFLKCHDYNFITSMIEHKSIMNLYDDLPGIKFKVSVDKNGFINLVQLENLLTTSDKPCIVSIQYANNEIGTVQYIHEIANIVHRYNGILHTDATQIIPDRKINVSDIDMLSFSGQKLGATKGIGVLYVKNGVDIKPIIYGSQEKSLRGGTENVPYIAGLGNAIDNIQYCDSKIRDYFIQKATSRISGCHLIGISYGSERLNNNASIYFSGIESESLLLYLDTQGICVSSGSACNSKSIRPSYVLSAIGLNDDMARGAIRFTFGEQSIEEINMVINKLSKGIEILRKMNRWIEIKTYSEQFEKYYEVEDTVLIKDPKQQRLYIKHGAKLADIFYSDDIVVYVFYKSDTKDLYRKWKEHTLV